MVDYLQFSFRFTLDVVNESYMICIGPMADFFDRVPNPLGLEKNIRVSGKFFRFSRVARLEKKVFPWKKFILFKSFYWQNGQLEQISGQVYGRWQSITISQIHSLKRLNVGNQFLAIWAAGMCK